MFICLNVLLVLSICICLLQIHSYTRELRSQQAAETWRGENAERFAQVSAFFPAGKEIGEEKVLSFRASLPGKLTDSGFDSDVISRLWVDAYSAHTSASIEGSRGSSDANIVAVGGDFFLFHPYEILSGSYMSDEDIMHDRVVLDYNLAWKLFGSADIAGMTIKIEEKPYYIAGVVRLESDEFTKLANTDDPVLFMSFTAAKTLGNNSSGGNGGTGGSTGVAGNPGTATSKPAELMISTYELVLADPISSFAKTTVTDGIGASAVVVENSTRYDFTNIYNIIKDFGIRSIIDTAIAFPYWENAARASEVFVARLYAFIALLAIVPLGTLIWLAVLLIRLISAGLKKAHLGAKDAWDDRYARVENLREKREKRRVAPRSKPVRKKTVQAPTPVETRAEDDISLSIESIVREIMDEEH